MSSGWGFTEGFFLGQLSVILVLGAFIKFFIFGEAPSPQARAPLKTSKHVRTSSLHSFVNKSPTHSLRKKPSANNVLRPVPQNASDTASILRKTYYQIALKGIGKNKHTTHQPESLDWFNVLLAQTIAQYRQTAYNLKDLSPDRPSVLTSLSKAINDPTKRPSFIDEIKITEISLGEEFPIFSNVRVTTVEDESANTADGRLQALMDVDLADDNITLGIETNLVLNYPKPFSAILPVALTVSIVRFSGTLSISFVPATDHPNLDPDIPTPPSSKPKTNLAFSFLPDYRLDLSVKSLIGSRSRLQDVPKIAQLVEARIQSWFEERVVEPRVQVVPMPGLWPRLGKTRVREGQEDDGRPMSQEGSSTGSKGSMSTPKAAAARKKTNDGFPSQEEAEAIMSGIRYRPVGLGRRRSSEVLLADEDDDDNLRMRSGSLDMPGSLPS